MDNNGQPHRVYVHTLVEGGEDFNADYDVDARPLKFKGLRDVPSTTMGMQCTTTTLVLPLITPTQLNTGDNTQRKQKHTGQQAVTTTELWTKRMARDGECQDYQNFHSKIG